MKRGLVAQEVLLSFRRGTPIAQREHVPYGEDGSSGWIASNGARVDVDWLIEFVLSCVQVRYPFML